MKSRLFSRHLEEWPATRRPVDSATIGTRSAAAGITALDEIEQRLAAEVTPGRSPLTPRPKGKLLFASALLLSLGALSLLVWDSFLRFRAFGTVTGRVVDVPPPWSGTVESVSVQVGDVVEQGQILATLQNREISDEIDRLKDELRVAQAEQEAEVLKLAIEKQAKHDQRQQSLAAYYELAAELATEQATLKDLSLRMARAKSLSDKQVVSQQEWDSLRVSEEGQRANVELLRQAGVETKLRVEALRNPINEQQRLKLALVRVEKIQSEIDRLSEKTERRNIRAPIAGRVVAVNYDVGEYIEPKGSVVALLQRDSLELLIYIRQGQLEGFGIGKLIDVIAEPCEDLLRCRVVRIGEEYEEAPKSIAKRFRDGEKVLPVHLAPSAEQLVNVRLTLGSEVRVPRAWFELARDVH